MTDFPQMPKTDVGVIESSEYRQEIFNKLLSGWSPARISESLKKKHNAVVRPEDIQEYFTHIPAELSLESSLLAEKFKKIDVQVDAVLDMHRILMLLRERLNVALDLENATGKHLERQKKSGRGDTLVEHRAKMYFAHLVEYLKAMELIGEIRPPAIEAELKPIYQTLRTIMFPDQIEAVEGQCQIVEPKD